MLRKRRTYKVISQNRSLTKIRNYFLLMFFIIMLILGGIFIKLGLDTRNEESPSYSFYAEKNCDYEVLLKPNDFYLNETLSAGSAYVSKSIDKIKINFSYDFKSIEPKVFYSITADLIGRANTENNEKKEVWSRTFNLLSDKEAQAKIDENISIDYPFFYDLARSFENEYGISIDAILKVRLNINQSDLEDYIELDIPVNSTVCEFTENYEKITAKELENPISTKEMSFYVIGIVLIFSAIVIGILMLTDYKKNKTPEERYLDNINRILKYYKELIVTVENEPDLTEKEVFKVAIFDDLIDVAEQNRTNIIHCKVNGKNESNLYVILDRYVYMYVVANYDE